MTDCLRIATFNLESLDRRAAEEGRYRRRVSALRPLIEALKADVLCLQEINAQSSRRQGPRSLAALDGLLQGTDYAAYARASTSSTHRPGPRDIHNVVTLSRFPITDRTEIAHDIVAPWVWRRPAGGATEAIEIRWERPLLYTRIEPPGWPAVHVINLHLRAPRAAFIPGAKEHGVWSSTAAWAEGFFVAAQKRAGQALEARLFVERLFDSDPKAHIAVCGDLNADGHEIPTRLLTADTGSPAGDSAERRLVGVEGGLVERRRYSVIHAGRHLMLDHILVSEALATRRCKVALLNDTLADEAGQAEPADASYHAPMVAAFRRG
jgi:endonuclease/exonuclease/phosphatase family metal-dependent hydrolase